MVFFERYKSLLTRSLSERSNTKDLNDIMFVRCTDVTPRRTEHTAIYFLTGVMAKLSDSMRVGIEEWHTPTIYRLESLKETMSINPNLCPGIYGILHRLRPHIEKTILGTDEVKLLTSDLQRIFKVDKMPPYEFLYNGVEMYRIHNKELPEGLTDDHVEKLSQVATDVAYAHFDLKHALGKELTSLSIGPFLNELADRMNDHITDQNQTLKHKPFELYFGHDSTLIPLLCALRVTKQVQEWPGVGSGIEFELYKQTSTNNYYVKMLYNGRQLILPGAHSYYCPYPLFKRICREVQPTTKMYEQCFVGHRPRSDE